MRKEKTRAEVIKILKSASREDNVNPKLLKKNMKETNNSQLGRVPKKGKAIANKRKVMIHRKTRVNVPWKRKGS